MIDAMGQMTRAKRLALVVSVSMGLAVLCAAPGAALAKASDEDAACGKALSGPVFDKWAAMGAEGGLGCPAAGESAAAVSPQGSGARQATFADAMILWHASGPRAGQTFAVAGCLYRLYFQYGGASGWLGLPVSDAVNTPDGKRQDFEGGVMHYRRAGDECDAEPTRSAVAAVGGAGPVETSPLDQFHDPATGDYFAAASAAGASQARAAHYERLRTEALVLAQPTAGAIPLKAFRDAATGAHQTVATAEGQRDALTAGYVYDGLQGYVFSDPRPGARPLKLFWNQTLGHALLTATQDGEADAAAQGYAFVRIEGYAAAGP